MCVYMRITYLYANLLCPASVWYSWKSEALGCVWGVSGFSVLAVWSQNTSFEKPWKVWLFVTQTLKYQNLPMRPYQKSLSYAIFSCSEQLNRWPCHSLTHWDTFLKTQQQSNPRHMWALWHLIRVMKKHNLTKKEEDKYKDKDKYI